ncbi:uncharacterized protein LOC115884234 [Sitophilus oryzae]|uniref:Uncharacterized protein LOC115884234 n=1 Tax=Sitophilus oryzae TaxID=7048 RepID=A0A6J2Y5T8_SITOR|nr:uncharacterized protein LOC115884234 [Sitophilus oryzae]
MLYDELMESIEDIPSDVDSVVDVSEEETDMMDNTQDIIIMKLDLETDSEDDPEDDLPLSVLQSQLRASSSCNVGDSRDWSKTMLPEKPGDFVDDFGITDIVMNMDTPTPGKLFQLFFTDELLDFIVFQTNLYSKQTARAPKIITRQEYELTCIHVAAQWY